MINKAKRKKLPSQNYRTPLSFLNSIILSYASNNVTHTFSVVKTLKKYIYTISLFCFYISDFQRILTFLREIEKGNGFASLTKSNIVFIKTIDKYNRTIIYPSYVTYSIENETDYYTCSFEPPSVCTVPSSVIEVFNYDKINTTGINEACLPSEATLLSTLECFYDQTCVDTYRQYLNDTSFVFDELNTTALDASLPSQYLPDTKIQQILNHVMLETINYNASYDK